MRFFLGAFEASIAPSMIIVTSMWWTRREQALRTNIWYSMNVSRPFLSPSNTDIQGMAQILGSLLSYGLGHANSSVLYPYQVIFLGIGLISLAFSIPTWFIFPRHPAKVKWLTEENKYIALERIRMNNTGTQNHNFKWSQVREACIDPKSIIFCLMVFCISLVSGGITAFGPLILAGFGLSPFQTILYNSKSSPCGVRSEADRTSDSRSHRNCFKLALCLYHHQDKVQIACAIRRLSLPALSCHRHVPATPRRGAQVAIVGRLLLASSLPMYYSDHL